MTLRKLLAITISLAYLSIAALSQSADLSSVPRVVKYTGSAPAGASSVTFAIYTAEDGLAPLWLETQNVTADDTGHYTVLLGATKSDGLPASIFASGEARWIGVRVGDGQENARTLLVSVPYALKAGDAETLGGKPLSAFLLADATTSSSTGKNSKSQRLSESGKANSETNAPVDNGGVNGTVNFVTKWSSTTNIANSQLFDNGTNVGLGTQTPTEKLEIAGNIKLNAANTKLVTIDTSSAVDNRRWQFFAGGNSYHFMSVNDADTDAREFMKVDRNGVNVTQVSFGSANLGVGTTSPLERLHVAGNLLLNSSNTKVVFVDNASTTDNRRWQFFAGGNSFHFMSVNDADNDAREFMKVDRSGVNVTAVSFGGANLGVGTTSPTQRLDVVGNVRINGGGNGLIFPDATTQTTAAVGTLTGITTGANSGLTGGANTGNPSISLLTTCATNQILKWSGTAWACSADQSGAGGITYPYDSGNQNTTSGAFKVTQTNSVVLGGQPTFQFAQTGIPGGLVGVSSATSNTAAGVVGFASSISGVGVIGWNGSTTGSNDSASGVLGATDNPIGHAIEGTANDLTGVNLGVRGKSRSSSGTGVQGTATANSGNTVGVEGDISSANGTAGLFIAPNNATASLIRGNNNGPDVFKVDGTGVVFATAYKDANGNPIPASGDGSQLTNLNASNLASGTVPSAQLGGTYSSFVNLSNASNSFTGASGAFSANTSNPIVSVTQNGSGNGVFASSATGIGILGQALGQASGVQGSSSSTQTFQAGVRGVGNGTGGIGVYGQSNDSVGAGVGVKGQSISASGIGGLFDNSAGGRIISGQNGGVEKFAVNGNGLITTKSVGAAALVSDKLILPAVSFGNLVTTTGTIVNKVSKTQGILDNNGSVTTNGWQTVSLPQGTAVTGLKVCGTDNDNPGEITVRLYRKNYTLTSSFGAPELIASANSGTTFGSTTAQCFATANLNAGIATVDNSTYAYYAEIEMTNFVQIMAVEIDH